MHGGRFWGTLFFLFMSAAALTTVVAVFENIIAFLIDELRLGRTAASLATGAGIALLSLPCALGFNLLSDIHPMGRESTFLDLEDYIVSGQPAAAREPFHHPLLRLVPRLGVEEFPGRSQYRQRAALSGRAAALRHRRDSDSDCRIVPARLRKAVVRI